jgi:hypothetical protein
MSLSKKQEYLIIAGLLVLIFPFFALLFFVHPQGDDFFFAAKVNEMGVLAFVKDMYFHWSGRYASMFLGAFDPVRFESLFLLRISLATLLSINFISFFLLFKSLVNRNIPIRKLFLFSLFAYAIILNSIPDIFEYLFWFPSAVAYQLGISLYNFFLASYFFYRAKRLSMTSYLIINSFLAIFIVGTLELFIIPLIIVGLLMLRTPVEKPDRRLPYLIVFGFIITFVLLFILAPGNYVRLEGSSHADFYSTLQISSKSLFLITGYLFQNITFILGSILLMTFVNGVFLKKEMTNIHIFSKNPLGVLLISILFIFLIIMPSVMATSSLPAGRIIDVIAIITSLVWIYNIANFVSYYKSKTKYSLSNFQIRIVIALIFMFMFSGIYITNPYDFANKKKGSLLLYGNVLNAYYTLLFEAKEYDNEMTMRYKQFEKARRLGNNSIIIKPLEYSPKVLTFANINEKESTKTWIFKWEADYFNIDSVIIEDRNIDIQKD